MVNKYFKWDIILNTPWTLMTFDALDIADFNAKEKKLAALCRKLVEKHLEISAYNIAKEGSSELCALYMDIINKIDRLKLYS
jgi:hypothetical protein